MKKISYYLVAIILLGGFIVSCSNDDAEDFCSDVSPEVRLAEIKQQFLSYGLQYGIEDMQFNDEGLKKHLNITNADIEREVLNMAFALGKVDKKAGKLRKKIRKKEITRDEEFGSLPTITHVSGTFDKTVERDSLRISYTLNYYRSDLTYWLEPVSAFAKKFKKCNNPQCKIWHETDTCSFVNLHKPTGVIFSGNFGGAPGDNLSFTVIYNVRISASNIYFTFNEDFYNEQTDLNAIIEIGL